MSATEPLYRLHDLVLPPSLLSLARLPLAALFPYVVGRPVAALGVLAAAGLSDVLDGWVARRLHQTTPLGAVLDGLTDKVFVLTVAGSLWSTHRLPLGEFALLGARDVGELATAAWLGVRHDARPFHLEQRACGYGKLATVLQFATVVLAITRGPFRTPVAIAAGAMGAVAALRYARRAVTRPVTEP